MDLYFEFPCGSIIATMDATLKKSSVFDGLLYQEPQDVQDLDMHFLDPV